MPLVSDRALWHAGKRVDKTCGKGVPPKKGTLTRKFGGGNDTMSNPGRRPAFERLLDLCRAGSRKSPGQAWEAESDRMVRSTSVGSEA